jgi:class 3 adenylate cyclase
MSGGSTPAGCLGVRRAAGTLWSVARLRGTERAGLPDRAFAYVDSRGVRRLPIHDASHVRNALARFQQVRFENQAAREQARKRLLRAAQRFRIVPVGFITSEVDAASRVRHVAQSLPTGFVTLLMTDVEGSTGLVQRVGSRFGKLVNEVWAAQRRAISGAGGYEIEARADEFFAAFESPRAAIDAAIAMQLRPIRFDGAEVRVRVGVHSGYPTPAASNYVGLDVNVTSRITAAGHGGQIVVSANTRDAVRATNAQGVTFLALGPHLLRGVVGPVELYQVAAKGLARRFRPLRL